MPRTTARTGELESGSRAAEYLAAFGAVALTTTLGLALRPYLTNVDMAMLFLLAVVIVSARTRQGPALLASVLSIAAFDFVFVPPTYTFHVHDAAYLVTFAVMLVVALVMSRLTGRVREHAEEADARARTTTRLSALNRDLAGVGTLEELARVAANHIGTAAGGTATIHVAARSGPRAAADGWLTECLPGDSTARAAVLWAHQHGQPAGAGTGHFDEADLLAVPLRSATSSVGMAIVRPPQSGQPLPTPDWPMMAALTEQTAIALERATLVAEHETSRLEVEGERLRTALLSSLSHDLRTPLASIEGAASSLLQDGNTLAAEVRRDLTETILEESRRMTRLVANLLDMIRVEAGTLAVRKAWQPLEETLGVALLRLDERLKAYPVEVDLPPDLPLVPIDELLIEQVFINLLENVARYCPPGTPVTIEAAPREGGIVVSVADHGPGIAHGEEEAVFQKFYRARGAEVASQAGGAGLGLTICRGIITAHGGRIWVEPTPGGGATFRFLLPAEGPPLPGAPAEAGMLPQTAAPPSV
jgi:two-component system sensor histidine kinase KdpD